MTRERMTYLNAFHFLTNAEWVMVDLVEGEFVLEAGARVVGEGMGSGADAVPLSCDIHEVVFTRERLGVQRGGQGNRTTIEAVASVGEKHGVVAGKVKNGPGGRTHMRFGQSHLDLSEEGVFPFRLVRGTGPVP